jgi:hypothetical protein
VQLYAGGPVALRHTSPTTRIVDGKDFVRAVSHSAIVTQSVCLNSVFAISAIDMHVLIQVR